MPDKLKTVLVIILTAVLLVWGGHSIGYHDAELDCVNAAVAFAAKAMLDCGQGEKANP